MIARWSAVGLALFHTDAWGTPEVHPSAAADILAGAHMPDPEPEKLCFPHHWNFSRVSMEAMLAACLA